MGLVQLNPVCFVIITNVGGTVAITLKQITLFNLTACKYKLKILLQKLYFYDLLGIMLKYLKYPFAPLGPLI